VVRKTVKKDQKRKAKKAAGAVPKARQNMGTRAALDALSQGLQESFTRVAKLEEAMDDATSDLDIRLGRIEAHLELVATLEEEADADDEVPG